jgi:DNA repair protein SbcC/Rad50
MIKQIELQNYQSHDNTTLEFSDNINVIYGPSDSGKSGMIRAFKALLFRDNFYIRNGTERGHVSIKFDNCILSRDYSITRVKKCPSCKDKIGDEKICKCGEIIKAKVDADFYVLDDGKETKEFKAFGVNLPDELLNLTRIYPIKFVDIDENFNVFSQFDDLFFVSRSYNAIRTKLIASLIPDSEKVDNLIKKLNSEVLGKSSELQYVENKNGILIVKYESIKDDFATLTELNNELSEKQGYFDGIKEDLRVISLNKKEIDSCNKTLKFQKQITSLKNVHESVVKFVEKLDVKNNKLIELKKLRNNLKKIKIVSYDKKEFIFDEFSKIENIKEKIEKLKQLKRQLLTTDYSIKTASEMIENKQLELTKKITDFNSYIETQAICPIIQDKYCQSCKDKLKI